MQAKLGDLTGQSLLQLASGEPDDEVDAEGEMLNPRWDAAGGFQGGDRHALVRCWPGRP
jgi:hypothetical protein